MKKWSVIVIFALVLVIGAVWVGTQLSEAVPRKTKESGFDRTVTLQERQIDIQDTANLSLIRVKNWPGTLSFQMSNVQDCSVRIVGPDTFVSQYSVSNQGDRLVLRGKNQQVITDFPSVRTTIILPRKAKVILEDFGEVVSCCGLEVHNIGVQGTLTKKGRLSFHADFESRKGPSEEDYDFEERENSEEREEFVRILYILKAMVNMFLELIDQNVI